jgi:hypothetical protein
MRSPRLILERMIADVMSRRAEAELKLSGTQRARLKGK